MKRKRPERKIGGGSERIYQELTAVAQSLQIEVREEKLLREVGYHVRSGGCRLRDKELIFLDRQTPVAERVDTLMEEIAGRELDGVYISPDVREMLEVVRRRMLGGSASSTPSSAEAGRAASRDLPQ